MRLAYILSVSFGSVVFGYIIRLFALRPEGDEALSRLSAGMNIFAVAVLLPVATISSLWSFSITSGALAYLPVFGILALLIGGTAAVLLIRIFKIEPYRAGSLFTSCMFSNISALAAFIAYTMFGDTGFAAIQLYALLEQPFYYAVGFPLSYEISKGALLNFRFSLRNLKEKPIIFFPLAAVAAGVILRLSPLEKPEFMYVMSAFLVPVITVLFGLSIGLTLRIREIKKYRREVLMAHGVKFLVIPAIITGLGVLSGLPEILGGVPFKSLVIVSFSPVGFLAVVPPAVYGFDVDLANSAWLTTTLSFAFILPVLLLVLG
jgi:hypothetical protein